MAYYYATFFGESSRVIDPRLQGCTNPSTDGQRVRATINADLKPHGNGPIPTPGPSRLELPPIIEPQAADEEFALNTAKKNLWVRYRFDNFQVAGNLLEAAREKGWSILAQLFKGDSAFEEFKEVFKSNLMVQLGDKQSKVSGWIIDLWALHILLEARSKIDHKLKVAQDQLMNALEDYHICWNFALRSAQSYAERHGVTPVQPALGGRFVNHMKSYKVLAESSFQKLNQQFQKISKFFSPTSDLAQEVPIKPEDVGTWMRTSSPLSLMKLVMRSSEENNTPFEGSYKKLIAVTKELESAEEHVMSHVGETFLRKNSSVEYLKGYLEHVFKLKVNVDSKLYSKEWERAWVKQQMMILMKNDKWAKDSKEIQAALSSLEAAQKKYYKAVEESESALRTYILERSTPLSTPANERFLQEAAIFDKDVSKEKINYWEAEVSRYFKDAYNLASQQVEKTGKIDAGQIVQGKMKEMEAEAIKEGHSLVQIVLEKAAQRKFIMEQASQAKSQDFSDKYKALHHAELSARCAWEEALEVAEGSLIKVTETIKPVSMAQRDVIDSALKSGCDLKSLRIDIKNGKLQVKMLTRKAFEQAVDLAEAKGSRRNLIGELLEGYKEFKLKHAGWKGLYYDVTPYRGLQMKLVREIADQFPDQELDAAILEIQQSKANLSKSREAAVEESIRHLKTIQGAQPYAST